MLKLHIITPGSPDYREWLRDAVVDASMTAARADEIEIEEGPALKVTCSGGSRCEDDDADEDAAARIAEVIRDIADDYEPSEREVEKYNQRYVDRLCGG